MFERRLEVCAVPTGVALRDPRRQLFEAAERVLLRDGAGGLTSRAVTEEAGVAKGVLHRYFPDFDSFLAALVLDRIARVEVRAAALRRDAGTGGVIENVTGALLDAFDAVMAGVVVLVVARDGLRTRLRAAGTARFPLLGETSAMIAGYLAAERDLGRIAGQADIDALAPAVVGAVHLLAGEGKGGSLDGEAVRRAVAAVLAGAVR